MPSLEELYKQVCNTVSDAFRHLPTICELAQKCDHVTELGLNSPGIGIAVMAGMPKHFHAYGKEACYTAAVSRLTPIKPQRTELVLENKGSLEAIIEITDMLIIDTYHTAKQLEQELLVHSGKVRRYICLMSTYAFSDRGEDGHTPGLSQVIMEFLERNQQWSVIHQVTYNNGMTILERSEIAEPELDRMYSMVTFDIPEVRWIERYHLGMMHPYKDLTGHEIEEMSKKQHEKLNRALRYGVVIGVERNFTTIKIDNKEILSGYLVYHVGFRNRPPGK